MTKNKITLEKAELINQFNKEVKKLKAKGYSDKTIDEVSGYMLRKKLEGKSDKQILLGLVHDRLDRELEKEKIF